MLLRTKIFLTVFGIGLVLSTLFFYLWIPGADDNSRRILKSHTEGKLSITAEVLIPLLLQNQYADVYESLDALLVSNSDWVSIELHDSVGNLIYPLSAPAISTGETHLTVVHEIELRGESLGKLTLASDLTEPLATFREQHIKLFVLLAGGLFTGLVAIMIMLEQFVGKPARNLSYAAEQLSKGDYTTSLPPPSRDEIGILANSFITMRDAIRENEVELSKLSRAVEQNPVSIVITDSDGNIEYVNPAFTKVTGYTAEEAIGNTPRILKSGKHPKKFYEKLWSTIASGETWMGEIQNKTKDGNIFWESVSIAPITDLNGNILNYVGTKEEITQRKAMEASLRQAKNEADMANQAKSDFLSSMSHELRTPMNAILGFGQMLDFNPKEPLTRAQKDCVDHIMKGGEHLLDLINDVLDLAKIEAGKVELSLEGIQLGVVIDECLILVKEMAASRNINIAVPDSDIITESIRADFTRIKQVLLNLMSNAIKYNHDGGNVTIDYMKTPEGLGRISVTDTGDGIAKNRQGELFQAFSRLGAENSEIEGTGIGLVVCKELIELMGGKIGFESEQGKGSTFWFELPLATEQHGEAEAGDIIDAARAEGWLQDINGTMLYVEDNPSNLLLMEMIVSRIGGLSMYSAHTAELGIEIAKNKHPDVIVLDINLPGMNGFEAMKKLQKLDETKNIPVLALSAAATQRDIELGMEAGFLRYLTKPMQVLEVTEAIKNALDSGK